MATQSETLRGEDGPAAGPRFLQRNKHDSKELPGQRLLWRHEHCVSFLALLKALFAQNSRYSTQISTTCTDLLKTSRKPSSPLRHASFSPVKCLTKRSQCSFNKPPRTRNIQHRSISLGRLSRKHCIHEAFKWLLILPTPDHFFSSLPGSQAQDESLARHLAIQLKRLQAAGRSF